MDTVSYLTINGETREIEDNKSREDITLLQKQVEYIAEILEIDLSQMLVEEE